MNTRKNSKHSAVMILMTLIILTLIFSFGMGSVSADSSNIYVNDSGGNDDWNGEAALWDGLTILGPKKTIGNATGTVTAGGTVNIADGTYTGDGNKNITIDKDMTIQGQSKNSTIINAANNGRIFNVASGVNVTISNLTIANGTINDNGGAIYNKGDLTVNNCNLENNTANIPEEYEYGGGGAIYNKGTLTVNDSAFAGNTVTGGYGGDGGAISNDEGCTLTVNDSTFTGNNAAYGGAISNWYGNLDINSSTFTGNTATSDGGAIYTSGTLNVTGSNFTDNIVNTEDIENYGDGGAIYNEEGGTLTVTDSTFTGNSADRNGGAIYNCGTLNVMGSTFTGNNANQDGGAIYTSGTLTVTVTCSTFTGNTATSGGAIYSYSGNINVHFNRIVGNGDNEICCGVTGSVNAENNWWGSNNNPSSKVSGNVDVGPWIVLNISASPTEIPTGGTSTITADLTHNSNGEDTSSQGYIPDGTPINFTTTKGTINSVSTTSGKAYATLNGTEAGEAVISAYDTDSANAVYTTVMIGGPDLVPTITETPVNPYTGTSHPVKVRINNTGSGNAGTFKVRLYDNGVLVEEKTVDGGLNAESEIILTWNWTPEIGTPGNHNLRVVVDEANAVNENNEDNNEASANVTAVGMPDILILNITTNSTGTIYTGRKYTVNTTIKNDRDAATGNSFKVRLYDNGTLVGEQTVDGLDAGESRTLTWDWTPVIGTPGNHVLLLATDIDYAVAESNETNNNMTANFTVTGMPDLIVLDNMTTNSTGTTYTGLPYTVYTTIKNNRDAATGSSFNVLLYDNGTLVGEQTVEGGLNAWEEITLTWSWTPLTVGSHTLLVIADSLGEIAESDEDNNENTTAVTVTGRPDILVLNNVTTNSTGTIYTGLPYTVSTTVKNNGDADAGPFYVELKDGSTSLGTQLISNLAVGDEYTLNWNWIPGTVGLHNLFVVTDIYDVLFESNEENNNLTANFNVTGRPELAPTSLTTNGTIYTNITYPVYVTVKNNGDANAGTFTVELFDGLTSLGTQTVDGLAVDTDRILTWDWTPLTAGIHVLEIVVDSLDQLYESNETNNNMTQNVTVTAIPDLTIISIAGPTTGYRDSTISITNTIKNKGTTTANNFIVRYALSTDTVWGGDYSLGSRTINSLAAGASNTATSTFTILTSIPAGIYYIVAYVDRLNNVTESDETNNILFSTTTTNVTDAADLIVTSITGPVTAYRGSTISITDTIKNQGTLPTDGFIVRYALSTDTVWGGDYSLGSRTINSLAAGASNTATSTFTILTSIPGGNYYLVAYVDRLNDVTESDEINNILFSTTTTNVTDAADLAIISITGFTSVYKGTNISITDTIKNQGTATANNFTIRYVLSTDAIYGNDYYLGDRTLTSLASGASNTATSIFTIPTSIPAGNYYILAYADNYNNITESNETNNMLATTTVTNIIDAADLIVTSITGPTTGYRGNIISITDTIKNQGTLPADGFIVRYALSTDTVWGGDYSLGSRTINSLAAGAIDTATSIFTIPTSIPGGNYYIVAYVDRLNNVTESDETNNILFSTTTTNVTDAADLIVTSITGPVTAYRGSTISITDTIKNQGTLPTDGFIVRYALSTDTVWGGDYSLGSRTINSLAAGASNTATSTFTILTSIPAGNYYLVAYVDRLNNVTESDETNNILFSTTTTNVTDAADLIVTSITGPVTAYRGSTISITDTIKNQGTLPTDGFIVRYALSTDTVWGGDYSLGSRTINSLAAGAIDTATSIFTIPTSIPGGNYYIVAYVDRLNNVTESDEDNNILFSTIKITVT